MTVTTQIRQFIADNFLFTNGSDLSNDVSFLESGVVDSLGILELVTFVEERFRVRVLEGEIVPDNFDSVNNLAAYVARKQA